MENGKMSATVVNKPINPVLKTPEQRKAELESLRAKQEVNRIDTPAQAMPTTVIDLIDDQLSGLTFGALVDVANKNDTVPTNGQWRGYVSKRSGLPGWSCGDNGFGTGGKIMLVKDGYSVAVKVTVTVYKNKA